MIGKNWLSQLSLKKMTALLVLLSVFVSLVASTLLLHHYVVNREQNLIKEKLQNIGRIVAKDQRVIDGVTRNVFSSQSIVQKYTMDVMAATNVNFVVVLNNQLIRLSHPDASVIGQPFSNIEDASKSLDGTEHFSTERGILGEGTRFFTPIWNEQKEQIGVVCVGYVQDTINKQLWEAQKNIYIGLGAGLIIGLFGAIYLARYLKNILFGLEPREIAANLKEQEIIKESVCEAILAVFPNQKVIMYNQNFIQMFEKAKITGELIKDGYLSKDIFDILFKEIFQRRKSFSNRVIVVNQLELIASVKLIYIKEKVYGAVATLRDQSDMQQLIRELSGTEQYIDSMRAQHHKFMNQLQTILGLIELGKFEDVQHFIRVVDADYRREIGFITDKIKSPAIAGFLLAKSSELKEQGVVLEIDEDSYFPNMKMEELLHDLLLSIGVLLDNGKDAVAQSVEKCVRLYLKYNDDEEVIVLEIQDTGKGIEEHMLQKIFQKGVSTKGENRGYGLNTVQSIVKRYNGVAEVQSLLGVGTIFRLELPYERRSNDV